MNQLDQRFTGVGADLMKGIQACHPASATFLSEEFLTKVTIHYKIQLKSEEILVAKNFLARKKETGTNPDMLSVYRLLDSDMFPTLKTIIQVALIIPVSSCSCERSFSALSSLNTWLWDRTDSVTWQFCPLKRIHWMALNIMKSSTDLPNSNQEDIV
ncbi:putative hAT family C-terminal dimerization region-containing protein 26 [Homarus americanus]|uniref:Putative hAT family C-terminal dimerization region-containing protein 26 n=1 Tax=Homarus americanus TaxID=6706 RepID=A0A8J5N341_HOMAM|nr:putative hAT family C-terminal dimerization region-containing protein 26 [Homarus americanus]